MPNDPESEDLTPEVGAATDVAPLGSSESNPGHELTAAEDSDLVDWSRVTQMPEFRAMVKAKLRFIIPAVIFFVVYYFALPGWLCPGFDVEARRPAVYRSAAANGTAAMI